MGPNIALFILLGSFTAALLGLITVLAKLVPMMLSHAIYVCQQTFSNVIFTLSHSIPLILIISAIAILLIGAISFVIQVLKTGFYLKKHLNKRVSIPNNLKETISDLNLNGKIDVVNDENRLSFCYGLLSSRICLSSGLIKALKPNELKAVLLHESYHLKNHDPLKVILSQTASVMFFFIPILKEIQHYYTLSKEIAADNMAIKYGNKGSLISVLNKLLVAEEFRFNGVAALASFDGLEKRILYLTDSQRKVAFRPSSVSVFLSTIIAVFSFIIVNIPVYAVSFHEDSMENSLFICPFGDSCATSCKAEKESNFSEKILYTPLTK